MSESEKNELLELYKLHTELADRASQRREGANRLYVSLLVGLALFIGIFVRFGTQDFPIDILLLGSGIIGVALSVSW
ncbi:MAG: hypothetical protein OXD29_02280 [Roseovarius sp.]|nr:hypothetical protein [Roseovarius sp.]MCY4290539.1 hypothetical protein [Roseovarius sp.]MCY4314654.1 hypothetical protein [Roseovarius sp.]